MHTLNKKTLANRLNAKKSTGPKTVLGKRRSSLNSITHGLTCEKNVSIGENKKEFEELKKNALKSFPIFDFASEGYVRKIIHYEWLTRRYQTIETGAFSRESLDYNRSANLSIKDYYLDSSELTTDDQKLLVRSTELPSVAFMRDANAGNLFMKLNTIDGRLYSRLRTAIKDYQNYVKSKEKNNEEK
ncbi:hypothetical protein N8863_03740 [Candidatus Pelagibacter ubique]|nr:hypothetical protein [Candidatus Pelagibacter ubique]